MSDDDPLLSLSPEEMRRRGYAAVDRIVDHLSGLKDRSPWREFGGAFPALTPPPAQGRGFDEVTAELDAAVFDRITHVDHPRFFSFVPGPGNFMGALGDLYASGFNIFAGTWMASAGYARLERDLIDWIAGAFGFPDGAGGLFTSGGSAANLTALAAARHVRLEGEMAGAVIYASDQTQSAVERALRILGFRPEQYRKLESDDGFRLDAAVLERAIAEDRRAGLKPFCVVANSGTTNTGAVDPLAALADLCAAEGLWLHVDGAYGACAAFCERGAAALAGLGRADSIAFDPHKWLFQPFEIGGVLVRDPAHLRDAFDVRPEYLRDTATMAGEINFCEFGPQLTRSARGLKLWLTVQCFGTDAIARAITRGFEMAEFAEERLAGLPDWEVTTSAGMGVITFRARPEGWDDGACDALNDAIARRQRAERAPDAVVTTQLRGRVVLRLCPINPRLTRDDLAGAIARLDELKKRARDDMSA